MTLRITPATVTVPMVSVLLPVYNGGKYLKEAIDSILSQSFADFELIAIDDGSCDDSFHVLSAYKDPRIRIFRQGNRGLAATLNRAISLSGGMYLARQDQDDISLPERFAKQVKFLQENPECGMVGTWAEIFSSTECGRRYHRHPADDATIRFHLFFDNPFVHSSTMIRKSIIDDVGGYSTDPARQPPEDYELWSRLSRKCRLANIPEVLVRYRETDKSMSRDENRPFVKHVAKISAENILQALSSHVTNEEATYLADIIHNNLTDRKINMGLWRLMAVLSQLASFAEPNNASHANELYRNARYNLIRCLRNYYVLHDGTLYGNCIAAILGALFVLMRAKQVMRGHQT